MSKRLLAALLALSFFVFGCGDDDDTDPDPDPGADVDDGDTGDDGESGGDGDEEGAFVGEFCADYMTLLAGEPGPAEIRTVVEVAPDAAKAPMETIAAGLEDDPEGFFGTDEFNAAFADVGQAAVDECADGELAVTAVDYAFSNMPDDVDAGMYGLTLTNEGTEMHEIVIFRKNDGVTTSFDEIFEAGEEASEESLTFIGASFVPPGGSAPGLVDMSTVGDYVAVCFIPLGSTPDAGEDVDGPPHFTQGMKAEFTVS